MIRKFMNFGNDDLKFALSYATDMRDLPSSTELHPIDMTIGELRRVQILDLPEYAVAELASAVDGANDRTQAIQTARFYFMRNPSLIGELKFNLSRREVPIFSYQRF